MSKTNRKPGALPLHIAPVDTREPAYTPAEQAEIARDEAAAKVARQDGLDRFFLGCECADAEGESY